MSSTFIRLKPLNTNSHTGILLENKKKGMNIYIKVSTSDKILERKLQR